MTSTARGYLKFAAAAAAVTAALAALGAVPTRSLADGPGVAAMLVACGLSLAASLAAGLPVARAAARPGGSPVVAVLAATGVRFAVIVPATVAAALSGRWPRGPLLVWVAISYLALLAVDTLYALGVAGARVPLFGTATTEN